MRDPTTPVVVVVCSGFTGGVARYVASSKVVLGTFMAVSAWHLFSGVLKGALALGWFCSSTLGERKGLRVCGVGMGILSHHQKKTCESGTNGLGEE